MPNSEVQIGQSHGEEAPVVIIGAGPAGVSVMQLLLKQSPNQKIIIYGNEPWQPYSREKLSRVLSGELSWSDLMPEHPIPQLSNVIHHANCAIGEIDRYQRRVKDVLGRTQEYSKLIIATGSKPHLPNIRNIHLPGVIQFRDLSHVQKLMARRARSRRTIVLGGGVLGIETAYAMSRLNTEIYIVEHSNRLMSEQLDPEAAEMLKERMLGMGIRVCLNSSIKEIKGTESVTGVVLRNDIYIKCDTIIVTAGIRPNVDLARDAQLRVRRGIHVNDNMLTSDENIYAIGECAEHRTIIYGQVAPVYDQAVVASLSINGKGTKYKGSVPETQLNVNGVSVFSMGNIDDECVVGNVQYAQYQDHTRGIYRKLVLQRSRLIGVISIGEWDQLKKVKQVVQNNRYLWPWQIKRFTRQGRLWKELASQSEKSEVSEGRLVVRGSKKQCEYLDYISLGGKPY